MWNSRYAPITNVYLFYIESINEYILFVLTLFHLKSPIDVCGQQNAEYRHRVPFSLRDELGTSAFTRLGRAINTIYFIHAHQKKSFTI